MKKILWISFRVPYDTVPHAGGKIHNFYLKNLSKFFKDDIHLVSFYLNNEKEKIDLDSANIANTLICRDEVENNWSCFEKLQNYLIRLNPFNKKIDLIVNRFSKLALSKINEIYGGESPSVIILQWTQIVSMLPILKKKFPKAKFVAIEEDVTFLSLKRRRDNARNFFHRLLLGIEARKMKGIEKKCLELADLTILNNRKDEKLLSDYGIGAKVWVWTPFFQNMEYIRCMHSGKDLLFYGAMSRPENYLSAIWFLENVFPRLAEKGFRFIVVGNRPHDSLKKYDNGDNIRVVGFVDDVAPYFENSLCLVAPLVLGAGVKIKILEAMSSGLPVLTNSIGIEGIFAKSGNDFFFCESAEDYERNILLLQENSSLGIDIGSEAKKFIACNYDFIRDSNQFVSKIGQLLG